MEALYFDSRKKITIHIYRWENGIWPVLVKIQLQCPRKIKEGGWIHLACYIVLSILLNPKFPYMYISYFLSLQLRKDWADGWFKQLVPFHTCWQLLSDTEKWAATPKVPELALTWNAEDFIFFIWSQFLKVSWKT